MAFKHGHGTGCNAHPSLVVIVQGSVPCDPVLSPNPLPLNRAWGRPLPLTWTSYTVVAEVVTVCTASTRLAEEVMVWISLAPMKVLVVMACTSCRPGSVSHSTCVGEGAMRSSQGKGMVLMLA
jgi:hypothetical protein